VKSKNQWGDRHPVQFTPQKPELRLSLSDGMIRGLIKGEVMMRMTRITPDSTEFVLLCFEGPDSYSMAGGLGVRINHLSATLAEMGFVTHLVFVGDPALRAEEARNEGKLTLHRWCQWISQYYPVGVYEGENEKLHDFNESLPWFLRDRIVKPAIECGKFVAILGEEWHTAEAMCRLSDILYSDGIRDRVLMFWNANNTFSFDRIDWGRLNYATTITTVSRYMKHQMWQMGLNPVVIPNGIPLSMLRKVPDKKVRQLRQAMDTASMLCKVARWDPAKGWDGAIQAVSMAQTKQSKTMLLARGGLEPYGHELMNNARSLGLRVREAKLIPKLSAPSTHDYITALRGAGSADIIDVKFHMPLEFLRVVYCASDAVLANSGHEPFGLVGLEAMAAGGAVITGCTGEDYAMPFINSFVLDTTDAGEIVGYLKYLQNRPSESMRIRKAAKATACCFTWKAAVQNLTAKLENQGRIQGAFARKPTSRYGTSTGVCPELLVA